MIGQTNSQWKKTETMIPTVLWDCNTSNNGEPLFGLFSVTLADTINNYDVICIEIMGRVPSVNEWGASYATGDVPKKIWVDVDIFQNGYHSNFLIINSFDEYTSVLQFNGTSMYKSINNRADRNPNGLMRVIGYKGLNYTKEKLWDYRTDNNNNVLWGTYSLTLPENADNYDGFCMEVISYIDDIGGTTWNGSCFKWIYNTIPDYSGDYKIPNPYRPTSFNYCSFHYRDSIFNISGTTFAKTATSTNCNGLVALYGIKAR